MTLLSSREFYGLYPQKAGTALPSRQLRHLAENIQGVPKIRLPFQIQTRALIQTTYCSSFKRIIAFEQRMRKNTQFYRHGII